MTLVETLKASIAREKAKRRQHPNSIAANDAGRGGQFGRRALAIIAFARGAREPFTDRECMIGLGFSDPNAVRPRISELVDARVLEEVGSVACPVTRKTVRRVRLVRREVQALFDLGEVRLVST